MSVTIDDLASADAADNFRMTKDWGRWYFDNIPTCDIAEATEDQWPSCSEVKKAAGKDWSFLAENRFAGLPPAELHRIAGLDHTQRIDTIRSHGKLAKNTAFGRGTIVHLWAEDLAAGREPRDITDGWLASRGYPTAARDEALLYRAAMVDFFHTHQPELVAAEYVTIHRTLNGHGYGATPDGLFYIQDHLAAVDWKTRGESSSHAAYPEEAAQIACGVRAEYMVVLRDGTAVRQQIPQVDVGYVVSIKPDGARLYPVDIDKAWDHWTHMHQWWVHKFTEKASIGRVLPKPKAAKSSSTGSGVSSLSPDPVDEPNWRFEAKRRYDLLNDDQRAEYTKRKVFVDTGDSAVVFALLEKVGPGEGGHVAAPTIAALRQAFEALPDAAQLWISTLTAEGKTAGVDWRTGAMPSVRRFELGRAVVRLAELLEGL